VIAERTGQQQHAAHGVNVESEDGMASKRGARNSGEILTEHAPATYETFQAMRQTVRDGPLPPKFREIIVCTGFMMAGHQRGYMTHAGRALEAGATVDELRHAILATIGSNATFSQVVDALTWLEEVADR
jgi:alkylhydroperoxidase/carboxymuconolactone decarboxylase family protein YurZ